MAKVKLRSVKVDTQTWRLIQRIKKASKTQYGKEIPEHKIVKALIKKGLEASRSWLI